METPFLAQVRAREWNQLTKWLQQVAQGNGGILFIRGDWGMGRTTLLRNACAKAEELGLVVVDTWCREGHGEPAWLPLASLMEQTLRHYEHESQAEPLTEQLQRWMASPQSWHIPMQFMRLLRPLARKRALLLCIDDLHLASDNLVRLIQSWLLSIRFEPIGLLFTVCTPVKRPLLYDLMRHGEENGVARMLNLSPLSPEEVRQLVLIWHPELAEDERLVEALHARTRGSPLFLVEILRHADLWLAAWRQHADLTQTLPNTLRKMLLDRAQSLSKRERDLLNWLSCFESAIPVEILPSVLDLSERSLSRLLKNLIEAGWLECPPNENQWLTWRHPLARETLYKAIPARQRARMHRQIAERLAAKLRDAQDFPPKSEARGNEKLRFPQSAEWRLSNEHVWYHWMRSDPDETVLAHLWEAHQQARLRSQPRFRLELLGACLHTATLLGDREKRIHLLCERPYLMFCLPDGLPRAVEASQEAIAELEAHPEYDPDRSLWVQVHCARAGQLAQMGRAEEAHSTLSTLLKQKEWTLSQQSMIELTLAYVHACQGDLATAYHLHKTVWQRRRFDTQWWWRWIGVLRYTFQYALSYGDLSLAQEVLNQLSEWALQPSAPPAWKEQYHLMQADFAYFEGRGAEQLYHTRSAQSANNLHLGGEEVPETPEGQSSLIYESWFHLFLYRDAVSALHIADKALANVRQAVGYEREAEWLCNKAQALLEMEHWQSALEIIQQAKRLAHKLNHRLILARCALRQAELALLAQSAEHATQVPLLLAQAEEFIAALALPELKTEWHRLCSIMHLMKGENESAIEHAQQAVKIANDWGHALYRGLATLQLAIAQNNLSAQEQAESLLSGCGAPLWWRRSQKSPKTIEWVSERGWEIEVLLLGEVRVRFRGRELLPDGWISPRTRALFCHLVLLQGRPVHADTLCEQHFPHLDIERARVNLQTTISAVRRSLRRALGEGTGEWVRHDSGFYRWAPEHSWAIDADEFERVAHEALTLADPHAQRERLEEALALYHGDLLPEFADEEWCLPHYHRLRTLYLECLLSRAQIASLMGRPTEAIEYAERLLQIDACDESATRLLMQAYRMLGRRTDALQVYARCKKALTELLNTTPSEPTRQLYESILKG